MTAALALVSSQLPLLDLPIAGVYPTSMGDANRLLTEWGHRLGPVKRPFRQEAWALRVDGCPVAVATTGSAVSPTVAGYRRNEVVELTRLCAAPGNGWANRVLLRLWREVLARRWACWPVLAAISYSHNAHHRGDLYRFDGWEKVADDCGSTGGGAWSRTAYATDAVAGKKTLWLWRYDTEVPT